MEIPFLLNRAKAFPVIKDLVDRSAFDRIQQAGGFVSINTSNPTDANAIPILNTMLIELLMQQLLVAEPV
jgi:hypothetical protein